MSAGFPRRKKRICRTKRTARLCLRDWAELLMSVHPVLVTVAVAVILSSGLIGALENRLRPVLQTVAQIQTKNAVTAVIEEAILSELERQGVGYPDLVRVNRGEDGTITSITTDMAAMNRLRSTLVEQLLSCVAQIDEEAIAIPMGSLIDSELMWGRGPTIKVRAFTVGSVSSEFRSEFLAAGLNQTLHKIWLELSVPTTILLPGIRMEVTADTRLCVAETVIVGKVPSYIQKAYG